MKNIKLLLLPVILLIALQSQAQIISLNETINHVKESYTGIKEALKLIDGLAAETKAKELLKAMSAVPINLMTPEQLKIWNRYKDPIEFDTRHISEVPRVPHQKEHFAHLTKNIHDLLDGLKMNKEKI